MRVTEYLYPESLEAALRLLAAPDTSPIAGGTVVSLEGARAPRLVDITRIGLDQVTLGQGELLIGAAVRAADLTLETLGASPEAMLIAEAAAGMATTPLRNAITVGGNLAYLCGWADLPVAALALDASIEVQQEGAAPQLRPATAWVAQHPRAALPKEALVTALRLPLKPGARGVAYHRFRASATENALVSVAVAVTVAEGICVEARVALGAVTPRPVRAEAVEAALIGGPLTSARIAQAVEALDVRVSPNFRMSPKARTRILAATTRRAILEASQRATGGQA
ncbi:FAD binding domain-containing protein [Myxococcota bacterium]|nr:FAD binding domain-containing protein [Myxococcota bacterium]MBU1430535.1 FAD binding domain-containing protein [Myxococcota bacterium]MBU1899146.1 FAD binding domain-containing protein [Myxococcota bacterium]